MGTMGSVGVSFDAFRAVLGRYFFTDRVSLGNERVLYELWKEFNNDQSNAAGFRRPVLVDRVVQVLHGLLWWEDRQSCRSDPLNPGGYEERILMFLCVFPGLLESWHCPRARPYCPDDVTGQWRLVGLPVTKSSQVRNFMTEGRTIVLSPDGVAHVVGNEDNQVNDWRVHIQPTGNREFWYSETRGRQYKLALMVQGAEMEWRDSEGKIRTTTWVKVE